VVVEPNVDLETKNVLDRMALGLDDPEISAAYQRLEHTKEHLSIDGLPYCSDL
jgi:hypothetical protein